VPLHAGAARRMRRPAGRIVCYTGTDASIRRISRLGRELARQPEVFAVAGESARLRDSARILMSPQANPPGGASVSRGIRSSCLALGAPALLLLALACGGESERSGSPAAPAAPAPAATAAAPAAPAVDETARVEAEQIFKTRCVTCHGPEGGGNGPASAGLTPPPRNFQDPAWQASVTDEHIEQIVQYGGAAVGKSPAMPANPDLTGKPAVVAALRAYVRGLKK